MKGSGVVKKVEEEEVVLDPSLWLSDSSSQGEQEEDERGGVDCEHEDPENWD